MKNSRGRPKGVNLYGESTKPIRIPLSRVDEIKQLLISPKPYEIPFYSNKVPAGFPSPADDYIDAKIDLNAFIIKHPASTFLVRASGDSMKNAGIHSNDVLIVDKSIEPVHGKIVIAAINGELTVKRLYCKNKKIMLMAENENYKPIDITHEQDLVIWGVVTYVLHEAK